MMEQYFKVVFNIPIHKSFYYRYSHKEAVGIGYRVYAPFGRRKLTGYIIEISEKTPEDVEELKDIVRLVDREPVFTEQILDLARWVADRYMCSLGEALAAMIPSGRQERERDEFFTDSIMAPNIHLAEQQRTAIDTILSAKQGLFYLYGVTGSGKTEVFLQVARRLIADGRGIIYLVPEISLTHQVIESIVSVLQENVAVLHSGLTASQRLKEWLRVLRGGNQGRGGRQKRGICSGEASWLDCCG